MKLRHHISFVGRKRLRKGKRLAYGHTGSKKQGIDPDLKDPRSSALSG